VAHDLNNILSGIVSYPELLLLDLPDDSSLKDPLTTIQQSGLRAAAIVQDLLALARRGVMVRKTLQLNDVVREYLGSPEFEKLKSYHPGLRMEVRLDENLLNVHGSAVHLQKTLMNLVSNAAEAMPSGGILGIATGNCYVDRPFRGYEEVPEGEYVILTVSDTGIGISAEEMEKIFEPFYTRKVMGRSGTGLGMAVVWSTVKDHEGAIDLASTEGEGTTIRIYLPATRTQVVEKTNASPEAYRGKGETILVIDDVAQQREIATFMLRRLGYTVRTASTGEEAAASIKEHPPDLLLLDMILGADMDGLNTYLKILELRPGQKAVLVSGYSETDRVRGAQSLGAGAYVKKPYSMEELGVAVRAELDREIR
jgi:CheY-like chemotaxis protein